MYARKTTAAIRALAGMVLALSMLLSPASAQQGASELPQYDVEIVIFRHLSSDATAEVWGLELSKGEGLEIPDEDATPFDLPAPATSTPAAQSFPVLPAGRMKLTAVEDALRRSRNYRPLAHIGWTQPGFARNAATSISIDSLVPAASGISGQVALSRGRYLHLTLDLTFTPPDGSGERYVLRQSRRMRSNERHYIDHPKFGVIAVVTPAGG
jgi:hypothetical protein